VDNNEDQKTMRGPNDDNREDRDDDNRPPPPHDNNGEDRNDDNRPPPPPPPLTTAAAPPSTTASNCLQGGSGEKWGGGRVTGSRAGSQCSPQPDDKHVNGTSGYHDTTIRERSTAYEGQGQHYDGRGQ